MARSLRPGGVLGVIAPATRGGVMPDRRHFFDMRSDVSTDDVARIGSELEAGHAAVARLERRRRAERAVVRLTELGGKTESRRTGRALRHAASAPKIEA